MPSVREGCYPMFALCSGTRRGKGPGYVKLWSAEHSTLEAPVEVRFWILHLHFSDTACMRRLSFTATPVLRVHGVRAYKDEASAVSSASSMVALLIDLYQYSL